MKLVGVHFSQLVYVTCCYLQSGLSLSLRNVSSMVVILTATSMVTGLGAITMAAHEILRQVWIISIQGFMALDITAQSLVASYLGQVMLPEACSAVLCMKSLLQRQGLILPPLSSF